MPQKRKVLIIIMDQLRADCIEGELAKHVATPNIDAFRGEAVTFLRHFSVANPCGPSRASLFTGRYAMNHRSVRNGSPLSDGMTNIAREARKSGYEPLLFGYTDTSIDPRSRHPNDPVLTSEEQVLPGFHEVLEMRYRESYPWRAYLKSQGYDIPDYAHFYDSVSPDPDRPARPDDPPFFRAEHSDTAFVTNSLIHDLTVRTGQNWFALVTYLRPHPPLVAPPPYNKMYQGADLPMPRRMQDPEQETAVHPFMAGAINEPSMQKIVRGCDGQVDSRNDSDVKMLRALYLGLITEVDAHFGRIIDFLKDTGQYEDTLVVLTSDHGELLGDHHMWGKEIPYDQAYRCPLIIHDPQNPAQHGTVADVFTESIDVTPTILDLIGRRAPVGMDGVSLRPFLEGSPPDQWRDCVHMELDFGEPDTETGRQKATGASLRRANLAILREDRFKLVHFNGGLPPLLFDLENDPDEMHDLAGDPAHSTTVLHLTQKLLSHRMEYTDRIISDAKITGNGAVNFVL